MKGLLSIRSFLVIALTMAVCVAADALTIGGDIAAVIAVAPVAAVSGGFDVSTLTCVSAVEFDQLKARYRFLYVINVVIGDVIGDDERYQFIVKRPDRALFSAIADSKDDIDAANDLIVKNLMVAGDKDALDDGLVFAGFIQQVGHVMQQGKGFFVKA